MTDTITATEQAAREFQESQDAATDGPWEVWTGCSWRRIGSVPLGRTAIEPTNHPHDHHPDLMSGDGSIDENLALACTARNTNLPELALKLVAECRKRESDNDIAIGYAIGVMDGVRISKGNDLSENQREALAEAARRLEAFNSGDSATRGGD